VRCPPITVPLIIANYILRFRWVFCQLEALKKCPPLQDPIRKALKNLPATLDETYERILGTIDDEDSQQIARRSLIWLAFSERSLYLKELAEAAVIDTQFSDPERLPDPRYILELLGSLVTISLKGTPSDDDQDDCSEESPRNNHKDVPGEVIRLAHFSVKEYLVSKRIRLSKASIFGVEDVDVHRFIAEICLLYILHYDQSGSKTISPKDLEIFPILQYACEFWYIHRNLISVESQKAMDPIIFKLFLSDAALLSWLRVHRPDKPWKKPFEIPNDISSPLCHASGIGLEAVVRLLIEAKVDVDTKSSSGRTALYRAAVNGHEAVVQLLIEAKADVDAKSSDGWTALYVAAANGHEAVVQLLIEAKADVDAMDNDGRTALYRAAINGHEAVVQLLIEAKADIDTKSSSGRTALYRAAVNGHEAVVQLLIEAKADVDAMDNDGRTALYAAADNGHEAVVQLLIKAKADVNAKSSNGQTALYRAAANGHEAVVQLLALHAANS
jgi:ankyrin repeat domain-containing protein 50